MADNDKPKRQRLEQQVHTNPGDNTKYINHSLKLSALPKVQMSDAANVAQRVEDYFRICAEDDMKPSVAGLALALDIERSYLWELRAGKKGKNPDVANTLKKAMKILDLQMTDYMQNGKINPVSGIFLMKNNFGYADKQEITVTPKPPLGEQIAPDALADKYRDSIPADFDEN